MLLKFLGDKFNDFKALGQKAINSVMDLGSKVGSFGKAVVQNIYDGEMHGILQLPDGTFQKAQYMGPGSRIDLRLDAGQEGLTPIDKASLAHDLRYQLSNTDKANRQNLIREADNIFNKKIDYLRETKGDSEFNLKQAELIKAKVALENIHPLVRDSIFNFSNRKTSINESPEYLEKYRAKLSQLEKDGY